MAVSRKIGAAQGAVGLEGSAHTLCKARPKGVPGLTCRPAQAQQWPPPASCTSALNQTEIQWTINCHIMHTHWPHVGENIVTQQWPPQASCTSALNEQTAHVFARSTREDIGWAVLPPEHQMASALLSQRKHVQHLADACSFHL